MSSYTTKEQVSAGGVVFRRAGVGRVEVALISVGGEGRWQLPKGLVGRGESAEEAALREVREETGLAAEVVAPLETIEYWYFSKGGRGGAERVRFHKFVHFFLMSYAAGDVSDHDDEVNEARWIEVGEAARLLAFRGERKVLEQARGLIG
ncbi:MAG TPA: NUDIX domain-containing protein [Pyrinomonadaceae bacterium]|nr:NUDIX domain-containing protein [Pyrinomonadaceae bacterium]